MKNLIYILIALTICSCSSLKVQQADVIGQYYKLQTSRNTLSVSYDLILKKDNSFSLSIRMQDANPMCNGKWELKDNRYIYLECDDVKGVAEMLSSGSMTDKNYKLEVLSKNKIRFKDVILKRKNKLQAELVHEAIHSNSQ